MSNAVLSAPEPVRSSLAAPFSRWLIVTQYYPPEPGAPQIRLSALARELTRHGCSVQVLTALPNYPFGRIADAYRGRLSVRELRDGIPVERLWLYPAAGRKPVSRLLCYSSFTLAAISRIVSYRPDVVFVEAQPITLALAGVVLKALRGVPFIYNTPDLQVEIAGDKRWITIQALIRGAARLESALMRKALCVATVTDAFVDHFAQNRGVPKSRITFLPNGADTEALLPLPADDEYARALGVSGKTVFTYAGTHAPYHGLEIMLEAAEQLRDRQDIVLLMVGNGPIRQDMERQAAQRKLSNLVFRDSPFSEMVRLMSISRAAIATISDMQAASKMRLSKVVPPLACGRPVIYVGKGESVRLLREHNCGVAVESGRADEFAAAVRMLADSPTACQEMGANGRRLAESEFSWQLIVERWLEQVNAVVAGRDPWVASPDRASAE
ncbi:MAG TPA: glycosyltransferase family 4 protein [Candidatus Acidoferrales bacterium]|jgi:colanic acid biosynthesis glycosyl transferase WcaI|nr:glycosyltransferase family 4 protein [Candidatus Acidoferrales bacterium]